MIPNLIVPTLNQYDRLKRMIYSIDYPVKHLLIIDNGGRLSLDSIPDMVEQVTVLNMPANLGVASSWNLGIKSFPHDDRWFIASDDVMFEPGALEDWFNLSDNQRLVTSSEAPHWQFFCIGENVVGTVGLFDEAIHPANFEDDEYEWRCEVLGAEIVRAEIGHFHEAHATVFSPEYVSKNRGTYVLNESYFKQKQRDRDYSDGFWTLSRRRILSWD